ncbi:hypothetical protein QJN88_14340 [Escherichia coli]|uniref:hypothetical protein n=1 Tax=Escherichia coli TaxID=562 RepID=UPI0013B04D13|nr:hypothetical protein [Escherichia coli]EHW3224007.1 hypothetical protein [Escherichia coli]EHX8088518.1 hypothetical protein [Escherichia coli]HAW7819447.1 hypothetical protein [Escherichia coli]
MPEQAITKALCIYQGQQINLAYIRLRHFEFTNGRIISDFNGMGKVKYHFFNDKKSVISCVSDNKHSFKTFRNNQNTGIPLVNIFTYEINKYWNI